MSLRLILISALLCVILQSAASLAAQPAIRGEVMGLTNSEFYFKHETKGYQLVIETRPYQISYDSLIPVFKNSSSAAYALGLYNSHRRQGTFWLAGAAPAFLTGSVFMLLGNYGILQGKKRDAYGMSINNLVAIELGIASIASIIKGILEKKRSGRHLNEAYYELGMFIKSHYREGPDPYWNRIMLSGNLVHPYTVNRVSFNRFSLNNVIRKHKPAHRRYRLSTFFMCMSIICHGAGGIAYFTGTFGDGLPDFGDGKPIKNFSQYLVYTCLPLGALSTVLSRYLLRKSIRTFNRELPPETAWNFRFGDRSAGLAIKIRY